jgi:hypothetical protein
MIGTSLAAISGVTYDHGQPRPVAGFPIRRGATTSTVVFVDLLATDGTIVYGAQVDPSELNGIQVVPLRSSATDALLWKVAIENIGGWGNRSLAELAYREAGKLVQREIAEQVVRSRRAPSTSLIAEAALRSDS